MRDVCEGIVDLRRGQHPDEPSEITVNCPDKVGLGCDFARIVFEFGLSVIRGDLSTDGKWCFVVLWVVSRGGPVRWSLLKQRLEAACPSSHTPLLVPVYFTVQKPKEMYLLQVCSTDRSGLLNDVAQTLWEMELTIHKVKISTSPDGKAVNLFFVTDNRHKAVGVVPAVNVLGGKAKLPWEKRAEEVCERVRSLLGVQSTDCKLSVAGPECGALNCLPASTLPPSVAKDLFDISVHDMDLEKPPKGHSLQCAPVITIDNVVSPAHTSLQILCKDRKGLFFDCMRTLKDGNYQVAFGRISTLEKGSCEISLFILEGDGGRIVDEKKQNALCDAMMREIKNPLRVVVVARGPDTELLVATPIERCGRGRPRVLYDVTLALKKLDICIFKADIGRHMVDGRQWEVYRFLLIDKPELELTSSRFRRLLTEQVQNVLMG